MSSLMYPKVFSDYMARQAKLGPLLQLLPTRVYWYAMVSGDAFSFDLNKAQLAELLTAVPAAFAGAEDSAAFTARLELVRVSALQRHFRTVVFKVQVQQQGGNGAAHEETHQVQVKDMGGVFVFEGPMADPAKSKEQVGSPMAGVVEKVEVKAGQTVKAGDLLVVVSAMKMEVKVTAPCDSVVASVAVPSVGKYTVVYKIIAVYR
jgi:pyruvate carboxylase